MTPAMDQTALSTARAALVELCESGSPVVRPETVDKTLTFEPDPTLAGPLKSDYHHLATTLAKVFSTA